MASVGKATFFDKVRNSKKLLVMDLGFLGDAVHLIPSLWALRQALPETELHVVVSEHVTNILEVVPYIDRVVGYPRFPKGPPIYKDIGRMMQWRQEGYDAVINLNGSDRSSWLTLFTGAKHRLGRVPPKVRKFWKYCVTDAVYVPRGTMVVYKQSLECLRLAGFPVEEAVFRTEVPKALYDRIDPKIDGRDDFIHVSPFTTQDYKELPEGVQVDFLNRLNESSDGRRMVLTCAPDNRERGKMAQLLSKLDFEPWRVFDGNLSLMELVALISRAKLHLGGDSGAMHVAFMVNTPTVSWFREYENKVEWKPEGEAHMMLVGEATSGGIIGIEAEDLVREVVTRI